ncbi:MAG: hypothetical protein DHS20C07_05250 [Methyloligella sp.]|nr:MAG: hypothetical protein DHS20C07_05250 [Methyloligella sp.]
MRLKNRFRKKQSYRQATAKIKTSHWQDEIRKISQQRPSSPLFTSDKKVEKGGF